MWPYWCVGWGVCMRPAALSQLRRSVEPGQSLHALEVLDVPFQTHHNLRDAPREQPVEQRGNSFEPSGSGRVAQMGDVHPHPKAGSDSRQGYTDSPLLDGLSEPPYEPRSTGNHAGPVIASKEIEGLTLNQRKGNKMPGRPPWAVMAYLPNEKNYDYISTSSRPQPKDAFDGQSLDENRPRYRCSRPHDRAVPPMAPAHQTSSHPEWCAPFHAICRILLLRGCDWSVGEIIKQSHAPEVGAQLHEAAYHFPVGPSARDM
eukprot:7971025-Pyramimonas_sp.AAC.1